MYEKKKKKNKTESADTDSQTCRIQDDDKNDIDKEKEKEEEKGRDRCVIVLTSVQADAHSKSFEDWRDPFTAIYSHASSGHKLLLLDTLDELQENPPCARSRARSHPRSILDIRDISHWTRLTGAVVSSLRELETFDFYP